MASNPPFQAPSALQYFATLVAEDRGFPLLEAAVAVAQDHDPGLDVQAVLAQVDALAERLRRRVPADAAPLQRLRLLNHFFFGELGFAGNVNDYYDPLNSYLPAVLERRRGIPITLALIYLEIAQQLGLRAQGVSFPGHFLVKLQMPAGEVVIDPFSGGSLSREALDERLQPYLQQQGLVDELAVPLYLFLQPAAPREVLARLLRNLKHIHRSQASLRPWLQVQQRLVLLLPAAWEERRDLALVQGALGDHAAAAAEMQTYLARCPDAADRAEMRAQLAEWRRAAGPLLH